MLKSLPQNLSIIVPFCNKDRIRTVDFMNNYTRQLQVNVLSNYSVEYFFQTVYCFIQFSIEVLQDRFLAFIRMDVVENSFCLKWWSLSVLLSL